MEFTKRELEILATSLDKVPVQGAELIMEIAGILEKIRRELEDGKA